MNLLLSVLFVVRTVPKTKVIPANCGFERRRSGVGSRGGALTSPVLCWGVSGRFLDIILHSSSYWGDVYIL